MRNFAFVMFFFKNVLRTFPLGEDAMQCQMIGSPESPLFSKDGDIIIGGVFSIHSRMSRRDLSYRETPGQFRCSRYY